MSKDDPYNLERFLVAQEAKYDDVLEELKDGEKRTHWIWFIFPQIEGLGHSEASRYYSIKSKAEAQAYLNHPVLGARLVECTELVLAVRGRSISEIFDFPDDMKFLSCMTLFAAVSEPDSVFARAIDQYFDGVQDQNTHRLLDKR